MGKKNLDWKNLPFQYINTEFRFVAKYQEDANQVRKWNTGELIHDNQIHLHESSVSLHYAQQCFEGMKAYSSPKNEVLLFRPLENAKRMQSTARRLMMPEVSNDLFLKGVEETVRANYAWIPPYGTGASLYIRPILFGVGAMLRLEPSLYYEFRVFVSPVGPYFSSKKMQAIKFYLALDYDRAAPQGIGSFKAGSNYAAGFFIKQLAIKKGASEALFLDSKHQRYLDESGAANIIILTKDKTLITPKFKRNRKKTVYKNFFIRACASNVTKNFFCTVQSRCCCYWCRLSRFICFS